MVCGYLIQLSTSDLHTSNYKVNIYYFCVQTIPNEVLTMNYVFDLRMKVRDYELDVQGVVNNANYQHYLEHARHEFLESAGITFMELTNRGIVAVVAKIEMEFKQSLVSGDQFECRLAVKKEGVKFIFLQDIYRVSDGALILKGVVTTVCMENGRIIRTGYLDEMIAPYLMKN